MRLTSIFIIYYLFLMTKSFLLGTIITVENLFYNLPSRRQAYAANNTENYQNILDVVTRYAIHYGNHNISFTCKRSGGSSSSNGGMNNSNIPTGNNSNFNNLSGNSMINGSADVYTPNHSNILNNIKIIYGNTIASQLLSYEYNHNTNNTSNANNSTILTTDKPIQEVG